MAISERPRAITPRPPPPQALGAGLSLPKTLCLRYAHVAAVGFLVAVFLVANALPLWHTDVWAHLKYGDWILAHRSLPHHEPFLGALSGETAIAPHAWLSQVLMASLFHLGQTWAGGDTFHRTAGGVEMLRGWFALVLTLKALVLLAAFLRLSQSWTVSLLGVALALLLDIEALPVFRPQIFGELAFAVMLYLLSDPKFSLVSALAVPPLMVLWANLHGSFLVGLVIFFGANLGAMLPIFRQHGTRPSAYLGDARFMRITRAFYASLIAVGLLNPMGFAIYPSVWWFGSHPNLTLMDEWQPLAWRSPWGVLFVASVILALVTHALALRYLKQPPGERAQERGIPLGQLILLAIFGMQTILHQRLMPWWAMLLPWVCMATWGRLWGHAWPRPFANQRTLPQPLVVAIRPLLLMVVMAWLGVAWSGAGQWWQTGAPRALHRAVHPATPVAVAAQLVEPEKAIVPGLDAWLRRQPGGRRVGPIFASETLGDYLLWALPPETPPLAYTHAHAVPVDHWQAVLAVKRGEGDWELHLNRWQANVVLVEAELHPQLRKQLHRAAERWQILIDEYGDAQKPNPKSRLLLAVRRAPVGAASVK
jgi:hypothetical protein